MSIKGKMTAIADKIRALLGISGTMGLDAMATNLGTAVDEAGIQTDLIAQITAVLADKVVPGDPEVSIFNAIAAVSSNSQQISFTGLPGEPQAFAIVPTSAITLNTSSRFVVGVWYVYDYLLGVYGYGSGSAWSATYKTETSASYFTQSYNNGVLTIKTESTTNGGYFAANVDYVLLAVC